MKEVKGCPNNTHRWKGVGNERKPSMVFRCQGWIEQGTGALGVQHDGFSGIKTSELLD